MDVHFLLVTSHSRTHVMSDHIHTSYQTILCSRELVGWWGLLCWPSRARSSHCVWSKSFRGCGKFSSSVGSGCAMAPKRPGPKVDDASQKAFDMMMSGKSLREAVAKTGLPETAGDALRQRVLRYKKKFPSDAGPSSSAGPAKQRQKKKPSKRTAAVQPVGKGIPRAGARDNPIQAGKKRAAKHKESESRKEAFKEASTECVLL